MITFGLTAVLQSGWHVTACLRCLMGICGSSEVPQSLLLLSTLTVNSSLLYCTRAFDTPFSHYTVYPSHFLARSPLVAVLVSQPWINRKIFQRAALFSSRPPTACNFVRHGLRSVQRHRWRRLRPACYHPRSEQLLLGSLPRMGSLTRPRQTGPPSTSSSRTRPSLSPTRSAVPSWPRSPH